MPRLPRNPTITADTKTEGDTVSEEEEPEASRGEPEASRQEPTPLLPKSETPGQCVFDPPYYSTFIYPKKYKRDDMGSLSKAPGVALVVVAVVLFAWLTYVPPMPGWVEEGSRLRCQLMGVKMGSLVAWPLSYLTGFTVSPQQVTRWLTELLYSPDIPQGDVWVEAVDHELDGVPVKIFWPQQALREYGPAFIYIHGGSWVFYSAEAYKTTTQALALRMGAAVVSIDYRLAPEHPYPAAFEDCLKVTRRLLSAGGEYGIHPEHIAIVGDDVGGNLAAAVALKLAEENDQAAEGEKLPRLRFQVLIYPALQMLDFNTHSYNNFSTTLLLTKEAAIVGWLQYLGMPDLQRHLAEFAANNHTSCALKQSKYASYLDHSRLPATMRSDDYRPVETAKCDNYIAARIEDRILDPYFSPLMAEDVSKVPPAYFILAFSDVLRDEGLLYAERLRRAGVATEVDLYPGMAHGFCRLSPVGCLRYQAAMDALEALAVYVAKYLGPQGPTSFRSTGTS